jgi:phosphoribosylformylglycinamidine synthase
MSLPRFLSFKLPQHLAPENTTKLQWLFGDAPLLSEKVIKGSFVGPRSTMITPWSTNAVEITQNMGIPGIQRIEEYVSKATVDQIDPYAGGRI